MPTVLKKYTRILPGVLLGMTMLLNACHSPVTRRMQAELDTIADRWVPDTREGICDVRVKQGKDRSIILKGETMFAGAKEEMLAIAGRYKSGVSDSILLLPDTVNNPFWQGLITLSVANLRIQPDHTAEMVSQAILGTPVLVLKRKDSWLLIQTPDRYLAWTEESSVALMKTEEINGWKQADRVIYRVNAGWLYSSPAKTDVVGDLVNGSIVVKSGEEGLYYKILMPDGREGYIHKAEALDFDSWAGGISCTGEHICNTAESYMGIPYLWGGTSSRAADCSGFVQAVFFNNGLILPRDASLQGNYGSPVDLSTGTELLHKGDLLFFGQKEGSSGRITHVAIYLGNSLYIHASGRVKINSLDSTRLNYDPYRKKSLIMARRMIGRTGEAGIAELRSHAWYFKQPSP